MAAQSSESTEHSQPTLLELLSSDCSSVIADKKIADRELLVLGRFFPIMTMAAGGTLVYGFCAIIVSPSTELTAGVALLLTALFSALAWVVYPASAMRGNLRVMERACPNSKRRFQDALGHYNKHKDRAFLFRKK